MRQYRIFRYEVYPRTRSSDLRVFESGEIFTAIGKGMQKKHRGAETIVARSVITGASNATMMNRE